LVPGTFSKKGCAIEYVIDIPHEFVWSDYWPIVGSILRQHD
jgi:hypothetical protein